MLIPTWNHCSYLLPSLWGWGQEPMQVSLGVGGRHDLQRSRDTRGLNVEGQRTSAPAWWDKGGAHRRMRTKLHGWEEFGKGPEICASAPGDAGLPWPPSSVWILKVHRYPHVCLWLKAEQPNVGLCRLPGRAAASPRGFIHRLHAVPGTDEAAGGDSHRGPGLHFKRLASGCKWAIDTASPSYPLLLLACSAPTQGLRLSSLLPSALHPALLTEPRAGLGK